jgi:hypothetical protein
VIGLITGLDQPVDHAAIHERELRQVEHDGSARSHDLVDQVSELPAVERSSSPVSTKAPSGATLTEKACRVAVMAALLTCRVERATVQACADGPDELGQRVCARSGEIPNPCDGSLEVWGPSDRDDNQLAVPLLHKTLQSLEDTGQATRRARLVNGSGYVHDADLAVPQKLFSRDQERIGGRCR